MSLETKSIKEIELLIKNKEAKEIRAYVERICKQFDIISFNLKARKIDNAEIVDVTMGKVAGYRGFLSPILAALDAHINESSSQKYLEYDEFIMKFNIGKKGKEAKTFSSTTAKIKSIEGLYEFIKIQKILESYVIQADKLLFVLQSKLNYYRNLIKSGLEETG